MHSELNQKKSTFRRFSYPLLACLFITIVTLVSCHEKKKVDYSGLYDKEFPLIIWRNPKVSKEDFQKELDKFQLSIGSVSSATYCPDCDSSLVELSGSGPSNFVQGQTAGGGSTSRGGGNVTGSGEFPFYYSANFTMSIPEATVRGSDKRQNYDPPPISTDLSNTAPVAIFDTGLDTVKVHSIERFKALSTCIQRGEFGWNFIAGSDNVVDDNVPVEHGTVVTSLIVEQGRSVAKQVPIFPVKTHSAIGASNLYQVLCGLAYASKAGVKVINASFGYYSYGTKDCSVLFEEYIKYYLTEKNILLICAAGNANDRADSAIKVVSPGIDPRNLDSNPFFPACFSASLPNVITVTTVNSVTNTVSPTQNYSSKFVDIGVNADDSAATPCKYLFDNPVFNNTGVVGSSFATPIVSGKIGAKYSILVTSPVVNKAIIISLMESTMPDQVSRDTGLTSQIKNGLVVHKLTPH